jgi:hypothetical protein
MVSKDLVAASARPLALNARGVARRAELVPSNPER